jgi:hypothetical protein
LKKKASDCGITAGVMNSSYDFISFSDVQNAQLP